MSMKQSPKLQLCRWDALVVAVVLLLAGISAAAVWGGRKETKDLMVVVSVDGEEVERFALSSMPEGGGVYSHGGYTLKLGVDYPVYPDRPCVRVVESDCPTQDCVHTGSISRAGQSIVCLPARTIIQLVGESAGSDVDIVVG